MQDGAQSPGVSSCSRCAVWVDMGTIRVHGAGMQKFWREKLLKKVASAMILISLFRSTVMRKRCAASAKP